MTTVDPAAEEAVLEELGKSLRHPTLVERQKLVAADRKARDHIYRLDRLLAPWAGYSPKDWRALDIWLDERLVHRPVDAPRRQL
jgi:hypothetical protein